MSIEVGKKNSESNAYAFDILLSVTRILFNFYNIYLFCPEFVAVFLNNWLNND